MNSAKLTAVFITCLPRTRNARIEDDRAEIERKEVKTRQIGAIYVRRRNVSSCVSLMYYARCTVISFSLPCSPIKLGLGRGEDTEFSEGDEGVRKGRGRGKTRQIRRDIYHLRHHADVG